MLYMHLIVSYDMKYDGLRRQIAVENSEVIFRHSRHSSEWPDVCLYLSTGNMTVCAGKSLLTTAKSYFVIQDIRQNGYQFVYIFQQEI